MQKKQAELHDRDIIREYSRKVIVKAGEWSVGTGITASATFTPINEPHLGRILEEKVSEKEIIDLKSQLDSIQEIIIKRFDTLSNKIDKLSKKIDSIDRKEEKVVVLKTMSREEAKNEVVKLFKAGEVLDYGIIAERLQLSLPLVVDICNELEEEGEIGEAS